MKCIVTGKETNNKWRGYVICKELVDLAKLMEGQNGFLGCSMRDRIIILQQQWRDRVKQEAGEKSEPEVIKGPIAEIMAKVHRIMSEIA